MLAVSKSSYSAMGTRSIMRAVSTSRYSAWEQGVLCLLSVSQDTVLGNKVYNACCQ